MSAIYWCIPLYIVAIAIAVVPVLYGTLRHRQWQELDSAQRTGHAPLAYDASASVLVRPSYTGSALAQVRTEAEALLERLEQLEEIFRSH